MEFATLKISGGDAIRLLNEHRSRYPDTGQFPFLIGDDEELQRIHDVANWNKQTPPAIIRASFDVRIAEWIAALRRDAEEDEFSAEEVLGEWPGEIAEKGSVCLHTDILTGKIKPAIHFGLATIEEPWHLPAVLKYGSWNACPPPEVHCAFHREWQAIYGAEITGMSSDVVECSVRNPPTDRKAATDLAWEQYWYCADIVDQGCNSVSNLAATLLNSRYWYFWWD